MIAEHWKDRAPNVLFKKIIHANLGIFGVRARKLVLRVVGDKISGVDCPSNRRIAMRPSQGCNRLKSRQTEVVRCVTFE